MKNLILSGKSSVYKKVTIVKNQVNLLKRTLKSNFKMGKDGIILPDKLIGTVQDVSVYLSDDILALNGNIIAVCNINGHIYVDSNFLNLSENCKKFILAHEYAHLIKSHIDPNIDLKKDSKIRNKLVKQGIVSPMELEADEYAANIYGISESIKALQEIKRVSEKFTSSVKEIDLRIINLKNKAS